MNRRNFIQNTGVLIGGHSLISELAFSNRYDGNGSLTFASPESTGVLSESIASYLKAADSSGLEHHGFVLSRHGKVIAEAYWKPFATDQIHTLYSLSKSFTSTAVGKAVIQRPLITGAPLGSIECRTIELVIEHHRPTCAGWP